MSDKTKLDIDELSSSDIIHLAEEYIHHDRNRRIFIKRYTRGMTIQKIVDSEFEEEKEIISIDQTKRVLKKSLEAVMKHVMFENGKLRVTI